MIKRKDTSIALTPNLKANLSFHFNQIPKVSQLYIPRLSSLPPSLPPYSTLPRLGSRKFWVAFVFTLRIIGLPRGLAFPPSPGITVICRVKLIDSSFAFAPGHPISISKYLLPPLTFPPLPGFLENRSTGSSALSWLARQAEHHSNPRWNPRETPSRPLIAFSSFDVVRLQIWAALRADAADPGSIYIYIYI